MMSSWTRTAAWGGIANFAVQLGDGFQPEDLVALASGWLLKNQHDEMEQDQRLLRENMNLLGVPEKKEDDEL